MVAVPSARFATASVIPLVDTNQGRPFAGRTPAPAFYCARPQWVTSPRFVRPTASTVQVAPAVSCNVPRVSSISCQLGVGPQFPEGVVPRHAWQPGSVEACAAPMYYPSITVPVSIGIATPAQVPGLSAGLPHYPTSVSLNVRSRPVGPIRAAGELLTILFVIEDNHGGEDGFYSGGFRVPPLESAALESSTQCTSYRQGGSAEGESCVVCLMDFHDGERLRLLPCGHRFHGACVDSWLLRSAQCPTCKRPVVPKEKKAKKVRCPCAGFFA